MYNTALRALELLGLADAFGAPRVPLYVLNVTYPLVDEEFVRFCAGKTRHPDRRGGPAGVHRAGRQHHPAPRRHPDADPRQGHAADGRRIYRRRAEATASANSAAHRPDLLPPARRRAGDNRVKAALARARRRTCMPVRPPSAPAARSGRSSRP